jgi:CDP-paratose 2-epimerase
VKQAVELVGKVFHFAAQVAVTTSLDEPISDFDINARGTLNLLEATRSMETPPPIVFTSTNKVYGDLQDVKISGKGTRYEPEDADLRANGFGEDRGVDFHSPYGCSKGAADQYVLDYARTFKIPAVVFRMSCIYGLHQFGNEDQGWVAHFLIRAIAESPITIYGDGKQVRDILFVDDLVDALLLAQENMRDLSGKAFNMGGGPGNTISLLELVKIIAEVHGKRPVLEFSRWRAADQLYYVSDTRRFSKATGWHPKVNVADGISQLYYWLLENVDSASIVNGRWTDALATRGTNGSAGRQAAPRSKRLLQANGRSKKLIVA